jgi:hypothetical protein
MPVPVLADSRGATVSTAGGSRRPEEPADRGGCGERDAAAAAAAVDAAADAAAVAVTAEAAAAAVEEGEGVSRGESAELRGASASLAPWVGEPRPARRAGRRAAALEASVS